MKICILMQAHKDLDFVRRIINKLKHKSVDIWVSFDKKVDFNPKDFKDCHLVKNRVDVKWGDISQSDATINSLKEIVSSKIKYDRIIFISGQDYPIKPIEEIIKFFSLKENKDKEFINCTKVEKDGWDLTGRYSYFHFKNRYLTGLMKLVMNRKFIKDYIPYGGSTWFNITKEAAEYIVKKYEEDNFHNYFKYSRCIDELVIQSIIMYKDSPFKDKVVCNYKRYVDWSDHNKGLNNGNPNILTIKDYDKIIASDAFFARKFDPKVDSEILDKLDNYLENYNEKNISSN